MDTTGGFNRKGTIELSIGEQRESSLSVAESWIRVRVTAAEGDQPEYKELRRSAPCPRNDRWICPRDSLPDREERDAREDGWDSRRPSRQLHALIAGQDDLILEVSSPDGWERWTGWTSRIERHGKIFCLDNVTGELRFGPIVRQPDGSTRSYGATPPSGSNLRVPEYRAGGGVVGNVDAGALRLLRKHPVHFQGGEHPSRRGRRRRGNDRGP